MSEETNHIGGNKPAVPSNPLLAIGDRLRTQDNQCTANPMFCVQKLVRDVGYDPAYAADTMWIDMESGDHQEVPPNTPGAEEFGWKERWETVMVAFTEEGCNEYMRLNGHNIKRAAYNGETRIYVESWNRCPEMIAVREFLMANQTLHPPGCSAAETR